MALSRAKNMTRFFPPTVLALKGSFCVFKNWPCLSHFSAAAWTCMGSCWYPYGFSRPTCPVSCTSSAVAAWIPPHWPCFPHFFRARRLVLYGLLLVPLWLFLALFPALLPRSPPGSAWTPVWIPTMVSAAPPALFSALLPRAPLGSGFLLRSLWLLPLHWPCFTHFFRGRRQDPFVA